jgi:large subunit ribosomal protein L17
MRHGKKFNHLKRKAGHRKALLRNMSIALIRHKRIKTTLAKAKALRQYIEPLVTKAKTDTMHNRRVVFSYLQSKESINELFGPIAEKVGDRPGGYVRVIRLGFRRSDGAEMAMIELVDFNEVYSGGKGSGKAGAKKKRTRRSGKSSSSETAGAATAVVGSEVAEEIAAATESGSEDEEE